MSSGSKLEIWKFGKLLSDLTNWVQEGSRRIFHVRGQNSSPLGPNHETQCIKSGLNFRERKLIRGKWKSRDELWQERNVKYFGGGLEALKYIGGGLEASKYLGEGLDASKYLGGDHEA